MPPQADVCLYLNDGVCDEPGIGTGACPAGTDTADCGTEAPLPDPPAADADSPGPTLVCPADLVGPGSGDTAAEEMTCECTIWTMDTGFVWGSGPYTADSSVCGAARHAGLIPETGGDVTFRMGDGCDYYAPSTANGIDGLVWRSYPASFYFPAAGEGACAEPPEPAPAALVAPAGISEDGAVADDAAPDGDSGGG